MLLGLRVSVEDELMGADKVEHGIDDPNLIQHSYDVNAIQNGHEDASKSVGVHLISLEASEIDGTSRKIIRTAQSKETSSTRVA